MDDVYIEIRERGRVIYKETKDELFVSAGNRDKQDAFRAAMRCIGELTGWAEPIEPKPEARSRPALKLVQGGVG